MTALAVAGLCLTIAGSGRLGFADEAGSSLGPRTQPEAGSTLESRYQLPSRDPAPRHVAPPEAGSGLIPRSGIGRSEAGSTLGPRDAADGGFAPLPPQREFEAGSSLTPRHVRPAESGSALVPRRRAFEASSRFPESGSVLVRRQADRRAAADGNGSGLDLLYAPSEGRTPTSYVTRRSLTPFALVLIALGGAALILFALFNLGMGNPWSREQYTRRLELSCDLAGQLDAFMDAVRREDWDRCQAILDHFHATNGRRAVLFSNHTNSALFRFLQVAINCRLSGRDPEYRRNLENKFALAIESLRKASRQSELLSLESRQYLVDANRSYRSLRDRA
jgi:hypothetical protein